MHEVEYKSYDERYVYSTSILLDEYSILIID